MERTTPGDRHNSGLLYASLLISLLAAFVAMLGKHGLTRYLCHTIGGLMIGERCGDRQHKSNGPEKWRFRLFNEGLPIVLRVALFLLSCGLSRYMWSINVSAACVVIPLILLGFLFYVGMVIAGTSLYECPFQTPASIVLRHSLVVSFGRKSENWFLRSVVPITS